MRADIVLGIATVFMAVLGTIVALHGPQKRWWKLSYGIVFMVTGAIAVVFVIKQSNENAAATVGLTTALSDLKTSTGEISRMTDLNTKLQERLLDSSKAIAGLAQNNLSATTGGSTFAEFGVAPNMGSGNPPTYPIFVDVVGKYPMRSVSAEIQKLEKERDPESIHRQIQSMHALPLGDGTILPGSHFIAERLSLGKYAIGIWSVNGVSNETMELQLNSKGELVQSYEVWKDGKIMVRVRDGKLILRHR
jgi:hypothetical protein